MTAQHHHSEPDFSVSDRRRVVAPAYVVILVLAAAVSWGMAYRDLTKTDTDHEIRLKRMEDTVAPIPAIQKDIEWLVRVEEARERREGRDPGRRSEDLRVP